ncbi:MAG: hypothetical protein ACYCQI_09640 [Gammaproteobacteria bacterium]
MSASHSDLNHEDKAKVSLQTKILVKACSTRDASKAVKHFQTLIDSFDLSKNDIIQYSEFFNDHNRALIKVPLDDYYRVLDPKARESFLRKRYDRIRFVKPFIAIDVLQQIKRVTQFSSAVIRAQVIEQYRILLNHFKDNKNIKKRIESELDKELLSLTQTKGDFEHLLNIKYRLCVPFKLNPENVEKVLATYLNNATESMSLCSEIMDVLVYDVDSQRNADIQKEYIEIIEKNLQAREEKSEIAAKNLILFYDKILSSKSIFSGIKDKDRPEYQRRKALAAIKLNLQHDLDVSQKDAQELKSQIETVIYSPKLNEIIAALLMETRQKQLQKSLINHMESLLLAREGKSLAAASNLIHFYAQCLFTKNSSVLPACSAKLDMQNKFIELLCHVYLRDGASDILRKQCKTYLKLLMKNDPQIEPQAKFALNFLRGIKYFSKNVPQNLLVCAKALVIMPTLSKEKVQPLYDWQNKLAPKGKSFKYGLFDDNKSVDQQYCELAKWYLEEINNARASSNPDAYLLQASVRGQQNYINDHVISGMKALGMRASEVEKLQRLVLKADDRKINEKVVVSVGASLYGVTKSASMREEKKERSQDYVMPSKAGV